MSAPVSLDSLVFVAQVRIYIDPARLQEFYELTKITRDAIVAEPECVFFVVGDDTAEPGCVVITEGWSKDVEWFNNVQVQRKYYKPYLAATEPMWTKPREFVFLNPRASFSSFRAQ